MKKDRSVLLDLIDGYEIPLEHRNSKGDPLTGKTFFSRTFSGSVGGGRARVLPRLIAVLKTGIRMLVYTSTRVYGTMLLFFGVLSTIARLLMDYYGSAEGGLDTSLVWGLALTLIGVVFMFVDKPIGIAAEDLPLTDYILFEFFCLKRMQKSTQPSKGYPSYLAMIVGAVLAALGTFVQPAYIVVGLAVLAFVLLSFASPEFSFIFTVLVLPYLDFIGGSITIMSALLITTALSFMRKVISGKRVYVFEQYDLLIGLMLIFVLTSGIFVKGIESFENSVMLVLGALGYVLASNLVTNRRLADRVSGAVVISAFPASVYVIVTFVIGALGGDFTYNGEGFYSSGVFGAFLIVAIFFTLSSLIEERRTAVRIVYSVIFAVCAVALGCILNYMAYIVIAFSVAAYFLLKLRKLSWLFIILLCALPYLVFLLPVSLLEWDGVTAILGRDIHEHFELWRCSLKIFTESPFIGIGMGAEAFSEEIARYGIDAGNSGNLFLELACEAGVFALIFFVLVLLTGARHRSVYRSYVKNSQVRTVSKTAAVVTVSLIIYSTASYIWESSALCYLFWCVLGLGSATLRIAKREHDDRIMYYNDVVSSESSDVDVQIDGFVLKK